MPTMWWSAHVLCREQGPPDWSQSEAALPAGGGKQGQGCSGDPPPPMEMFLDKLMVSGTLGVRGEGGGQANSSSPALAAE